MRMSGAKKCRIKSIGILGPTKFLGSFASFIQPGVKAQTVYFTMSREKSRQSISPPTDVQIRKTSVFSVLPQILRVHRSMRIGHVQ